MDLLNENLFGVGPRNLYQSAAQVILYFKVRESQISCTVCRMEALQIIWPTDLFSLACSIGSMVFKIFICQLLKIGILHINTNFCFLLRQVNFVILTPCSHVAVHSPLYLNNICLI